MAIPEMIRADEVVFCREECLLPGRKGLYHACPHDRDDKVDYVRFVSRKGHNVYIKDDALVRKYPKFNPQSDQK